MKKRHLYRLFNQVNESIFDGMLPKTKLIISSKKRDVFGLCGIFSFRGQNVDTFKITLFYDTMVDYNRFDIEHIKSVLIHEMVHLWIAVKLGREFSRNIDLVQGHDQHTFDTIGKIAVELGFLIDGDLLS
jgi:hypothetical protein